MKKYFDNRIFIFGFIGIIGLQFIYISKATANIPLMDYWKYINMFVNKMNESGLSFSDIWQNDGIHRSPLQFIYFIINVRIFNYNVRVEEFAGIIVMAGTVLILYKYLGRFVDDIFKKNIYGIIIAIIIFNLNQFEMINEEFALSFSSRMQLFLISFIATSIYLSSIDKYKKYTFELGILYILTVELVGGGYFPAYISTIMFALIMNYILKYKEQKNNYLFCYLWLSLSLIISVIIYFHGISINSQATTFSEGTIWKYLINFIIGMIIMLGVSISGFSFSYNTLFIIGLFIFTIYLLSLFIYFKNKIYEKTYFPLMCYGYTFVVIGLVCLGRFNMYGIDFAYTSRYVCETNVSLLACVYIISINHNYKAGKELNGTFFRGKIKNPFLKSALIIFLIMLLHADFLEFQTAPFRKNYNERLIEYAKNIDNVTSEEIALFQCDEEQVRSGIEKMRRYKLGVFKY